MLPPLFSVIALSLLPEPLWGQVDTAGPGYVQVRLEADSGGEAAVTLALPGRGSVPLQAEPWLTLEQLVGADVAPAGRGGGFLVVAGLTPEGRRIFRRVTGSSVGRRAAVLVGGRVAVLATIQDELGEPIPLTDDPLPEPEARALAAEINWRLRDMRSGRPHEDRGAWRKQDSRYGRPNPDAPEELSAFSFLVGRWRCESKVKDPAGGYTTYRATWEGRYILDGYVIADEFRQFGEDGELTQLGRNYRAYDADRDAWSMIWLDALNGTWLELGPEELGGVRLEADSLVFKHRLPAGPASGIFPAHTIFRITSSTSPTTASAGGRRSQPTVRRRGRRCR